MHFGRLQRIFLTNQMAVQALSPEEEARSVEERKTRVTLTVQEARDALVKKLDDIDREPFSH